MKHTMNAAARRPALEGDGANKFATTPWGFARPCRFPAPSKYVGAGLKPAPTVTVCAVVALQGRADTGGLRVGAGAQDVPRALIPSPRGGRARERGATRRGAFGGLACSTLLAFGRLARSTPLPAFGHPLPKGRGDCLGGVGDIPCAAQDMSRRSRDMSCDPMLVWNHDVA
jgi:hypothetical protein